MQLVNSIFEEKIFMFPNGAYQKMTISSIIFENLLVAIFTNYCNLLNKPEILVWGGYAARWKCRSNKINRENFIEFNSIEFKLLKLFKKLKLN